MGTIAQLYGYKVLVVEDEPLIGMELAMSLEDAGAEVEGPLATVAAALLAIDASTSSQAWTVALLDYRLGDETCEPIARRLNDMSIPIVFHTGSLKAAQLIAEECEGSILTKPSSNDALISAILTTNKTS